MVSLAPDTAEPAADTAVEATEAPPETAQPESAPEPAPDTDAEETSPETVASEPEPDPSPPSLADQLGEMDREQLTELGPIKDLLARNEESARRKSENETASRLAAERQQWAQSGRFAQDLLATLSLGEDGTAAIDHEKVSEITGDLVQVSFRNAVGMFGAEVDLAVPKDFPITMEQKTKLEDASNAFLADSTTFSKLVQEWFAIVGQSAVSEATPGIEDALRKALKQEQETEATAAETKAADEAPSPGPTNVNGTAPSGSRITTYSEAAAAYTAGEIDGPAYGKFREQFGIH